MIKNTYMAGKSKHRANECRHALPFSRQRPSTGSILLPGQVQCCGMKSVINDRVYLETWVLWSFHIRLKRGASAAALTQIFFSFCHCSL